MRCSEKCLALTRRRLPGRRAWRVLRAGAAALAAVSLLSSAPARADEAGSGHYQPGAFGFQAGMLPAEPGLYFMNFQNYYDGSAGNTRALPIGGKLRFGVRAFSFLDVLNPTYVCDKKLLGAKVASTALIPLVYLDASAAVAAGPVVLVTTETNFNLGDTYLAPIILGWDRGNFHWSFMGGMYAPTGEWHTAQLAPTGKNYWTAEPAVGFTYLNPKSGWEFSTFQGVDFNSVNEVTDYQSGIDFHVDAILAKHVIRAIITPKIADALKAAQEAQAAAAAAAAGGGGMPGAGSPTGPKPEEAPPVPLQPEPEPGKGKGAPAPPKPVLMDVAPGIGAYYYQQVTGDSGRGAILGPFEGRVFGIGPVISATGNYAHTPITFQFKVLKEFGAQHRLEGLNSWANLSWQF